MRIRSKVVPAAAVLLVARGLLGRVSGPGGHADDELDDRADDRSGEHRLCGAVLDRYRLEDGPTGCLGRPLSGVHRAGADPWTPVGADREALFEHGAIYLNDATQATKIVRWDDDEGPDPAVTRPATRPTTRPER